MIAACVPASCAECTGGKSAASLILAHVISTDYRVDARPLSMLEELVVEVGSVYHIPGRRDD